MLGFVTTISTRAAEIEGDGGGGERGVEESRGWALFCRVADMSTAIATAW